MNNDVLIAAIAGAKTLSKTGGLRLDSPPFLRGAKGLKTRPRHTAESESQLQTLSPALVMSYTSECRHVFLPQSDEK